MTITEGIEQRRSIRKYTEQEVEKRRLKRCCGRRSLHHPEKQAAVEISCVSERRKGKIIR